MTFQEARNDMQRAVDVFKAANFPVSIFRAPYRYTPIGGWSFAVCRIKFRWDPLQFVTIQYPPSLTPEAQRGRSRGISCNNAY